jgi:hypothetical protein
LNGQRAEGRAARETALCRLCTEQSNSHVDSHWIVRPLLAGNSGYSSRSLTARDLGRGLARGHVQRVAELARTGDQYSRPGHALDTDQRVQNAPLRWSALAKDPAHPNASSFRLNIADAYIIIDCSMLRRRGSLRLALQLRGELAKNHRAEWSASLNFNALR